MALECLPVPSKTALASRRQMFVRECQGQCLWPRQPWMLGSAVHSPPSVLINFTPSPVPVAENPAGSRPTFPTATRELLPEAQVPTRPPSTCPCSSEAECLASKTRAQSQPRKSKSPEKQSTSMLHLKQSTRWCQLSVLLGGSSGASGKGDVLGESKAWLT